MIRNVLHRLWRDEIGVVVSIELILLATLSVIGLVVALAVYRDAIVQELGDTAAGVASLQQSYSVDGVSLDDSFGSIPYVVTVNASSFTDNTDMCDATPDASGQPPMCMQITGASAIDEGAAVPPPTG